MTVEVRPDGRTRERSFTSPFATPVARAQSTYSAFIDDRLLRADAPETPLPPLVEFVHDAFRALVLNPRFSCLGARSAVQRGRYRFGLYETLGSPVASETLAWDLHRFVEEAEAIGPDFTTYVASFREPVALDELGFESAVWRQLRALAALDREHHDWDPAASADPEEPTFAFSFAGRALFVVGLHAASSRWTRRFAWPTLVFNPHAQFRELREHGSFDGLKRAIRLRELRLQEALNPNLSDFGDRSEARQYAGRAVEDDWRCPFRADAEDGGR